MATRLPDVISSRGETCALWEWTPNHPPKGLVVVFHGLAAHTRFPTVRIAAELLSANGYVVCGLDLPGHGASEEEKEGGAQRHHTGGERGDG